MQKCLTLCLLVLAWWGVVRAVGEGLPWWKTATLYQVYPRSFKDSDGDGVGDLKGITQKADHFKEIGVDAVWLSPIFKSPMVDNGYDISDFRDIDPVFGTLDDFKELVTKMKSLGVKLLLDMVPNHSSDQHEWFNKSLHRVDPYTDYYVWNDGKFDNETQKMVPPNNWVSVFGGSQWEWREERQQFYLHQFTTKQIDFNMRNPAVVKEIDDIITYWLDLGVDGFRVDAVGFLVEGDYNQDEPMFPGTAGQTWFDFNHTLTMNQPEDYVLMNRWNQLVYSYSLLDGRERAMFLELYASDEDVLRFYGHGNTSFAAPFNFKLLELTDQSTRALQLRDIMKGFLAELAADEVPNWVVGNHDNVRVADHYGAEAADAMGMLQGVLPGVKVVYYGEEIGMHETFIRSDQIVDPFAKITTGNENLDRDPHRTPMQWDDSSPNAGFSSAIKTWLPVNPNYWWLNVEAQKNAENSHLTVFKDVSNVRKDPVLQRGNTTILAPNNDTLVVIRSYNESFFVYVFNMGSENVNLTTQNFFSPLNLNTTMSVEVASINSKVAKGTVLRQGSGEISLRPKSAVILRSLSSGLPSSANSLQVLAGLLILSVILHLLT